MKCRRHNGGFTLIELIVIIMIIAFLSSVAVPNYWKFKSRAEFNSSVDNVIALFGKARDLAIQNAADTSVRFDHQSNTFIMVVNTQNPSQDAPTSLVDQTDTQSPQVAATPVVLGESVAVAEFTVASPTDGQTSGGQDVLRFHEDGTSDYGRITMVSDEGHKAFLQITPNTGRAQRLLDDDLYRQYMR